MKLLTIQYSLMSWDLTLLWVRLFCLQQPFQIHSQERERDSTCNNDAIKEPTLQFCIFNVDGTREDKDSELNDLTILRISSALKFLRK